MTVSQGKTNYRPDIDGLRALAILPVVFFHAGVPHVSGGFVGVDIFFVISGYLITSIILAEIAKQSYSITSFYERRIRRIFPALFAVLAFAVFMSYLLFLPKDFAEFGRSVVAAILFVSNILFWREAGYFDAPAELKPLLHTWSLAVEEQFYVFFPVFLFMVNRFGKNRFVLFTLPIVLISLAWSAWGAYYKPASTFYLAPTRAWELLLGALLAMEALPAIRVKWVAECLAIVACALIGWAIVAFSANTPFPGLSALLPCIGAALLIYTGGNGRTHVSRMLSAQPIVGIGLISYSLYLWHWPIIVFAKQYAIEKLSTIQLGIMLAVTAVIAVLSWKFIEQPFRRKNAIFARNALFSVSAATMVLFMSVGIGISASDGWPQRLSPEVRALAAGTDDINPRRAECHDKLPVDVARGNLCQLGASKTGSASFLVWGDSHADAFQPGIESVADQLQLRGWFAAHGGCPPIFGTTRNATDYTCAEFSAATLQFITEHNIKHVIMVAWWPSYADEHWMIDTTQPQPQPEPAKTVFERAFVRTLANLNELGVAVSVLAPVPGAKLSVPSALARSVLFSKPANAAVSRNEYLVENAWLLDLFAAQRQQLGAIAYPHELLCSDTTPCRVADNGKPIYFDKSHVTATGAKSLAPVISQLFAPMLK